jgi:hypothetical protein
MTIMYIFLSDRAHKWLHIIRRSAIIYNSQILANKKRFLMQTYLIFQVTVLLKRQNGFSSLRQKVKGLKRLGMRSHKCSLPLKDSYMFAQYFGQIIHLHGLWYEVIHSRFKTCFSAVRKNKSSKCYDRWLDRGRTELPNQSSCL